MKLELKNPTNAPCEPGKDLNVLISGEDPGMIAHAYGILEWLGRNLKEDGRLIHQNWDIAAFSVTALREVASMEAAMADIIIIGLREGLELPWIVQAWIKRWLELRQARSGALVAVLDADLEKSAAARRMLSQLKQLAAPGHLDFFVKSSHGGEEQRGDARFNKAARRFAMTCPTGRAA